MGGTQRRYCPRYPLSRRYQWPEGEWHSAFGVPARGRRGSTRRRATSRAVTRSRAVASWQPPSARSAAVAADSASRTTLRPVFITPSGGYRGRTPTRRAAPERRAVGSGANEAGASARRVAQRRPGARGRRAGRSGARAAGAGEGVDRLVRARRARRTSISERADPEDRSPRITPRPSVGLVTHRVQ